MINTTFIAEPIMTTSGQLVGCELLTRFHREDLPVLNSKYFIMAMTVAGKKELLKQQLETIEVHASWFREHRLFCTVNVDTVQARLCVFDRDIIQLLDKLDFMRLEISENFEGLELGINHPVLKTLLNVGYRLFLDDLGSGRANVAALTTGCYEAVKIDRAFYREEVQKPTFNVLMKNIMNYCPYVIVEGVEQRQELPVLRNAGVTAVQGYLYRSVPFDKIHNLI
ncbi:TPA: EAL domain-containing protein [Klebsiella quasipneumoniae subsp. quasipneumoniae]|uniref:EAL domain-containing protein n=1 Tax=Enterobacteriaceae TaxID=543 RepID=UPI00227B5208|nr:EAL domain-containing protein [Klebsiella pneumoniae]ELC6526911.1 EAL domain-containing protein [Enterobacter hormaechei]HAS1166830.1 EAL domain-containing protein [Enterobacter cloacae]HDH1544176.1 EAL domain-containing protein [Klebsiella quasipneumoniae subsp. quasipneumoniae]MCY4785669.1 EAL domain-containing protein [Klebsiella pneumoniae]HEN5227035.1 EAL domain-containing protein [Klebsiella pneumoniae]